jgi:hypothetical protein
MMTSVCPAETNDGFSRCADIKDDLLRLQCYDEMAGRKPLPELKMLKIIKTNARIEPTHFQRRYNKGG